MLIAAAGAAAVVLLRVLSTRASVVRRPRPLNTHPPTTTRPRRITQTTTDGGKQQLVRNRVRYVGVPEDARPGGSSGRYEVRSPLVTTGGARRCVLAAGFVTTWYMAAGYAPFLLGIMVCERTRHCSNCSVPHRRPVQLRRRWDVTRHTPFFHAPPPPIAATVVGTTVGV